MGRLKEIMPIIVRDNPEERKEQEEVFIKDLVERAESTRMPISQFEKEITEITYGRPIHVPLTNLGIRPFWRDGKEPPPLPLGKLKRRFEH